MKRKEFLLVSKYTIDYETDFVFKIFHHRENAKAYLNKVADGEVADSWIADEDGCVVERGEDRFSAYPDGEAARQSTELWIEELVYEDAE